MPWFYAALVHGRRHHSIWFETNPEHTLGKQWLPHVTIEIDADEVGIGLDALAERYKPQVDAKLGGGATEKERAFVAKFRDSKQRLERIIRESKHAGERENARHFYKVLTGKEWVG